MFCLFPDVVARHGKSHHPTVVARHDKEVFPMFVDRRFWQVKGIGFPLAKLLLGFPRLAFT